MKVDIVSVYMTGVQVTLTPDERDVLHEGLGRTTEEEDRKTYGPKCGKLLLRLWQELENDC
jgi:hypothetical protein